MIKSGGSIIPSERQFRVASRAGFFYGIARRMLLNQMAQLRCGQLTIVEGTNRRSFGDTGRFPVAATVTVHHPLTYLRILLGGSIGAGEGYMTGLWATDHLTDVIRILVRNESVMAGMEKGWASLSVPVQRLYHWFQRNTHQGSRLNIAAHYDLGNDFYRLFLDETMTYSCGIFKSPDASLASASLAKYDRICRRLQLSPEDHVLEIGTGWGGFAIHAAGRYGCRVTTTTISEEQYRFARRRIEQAGLSDRVRVIFSDYRDLKGTYDKLVSIEMIEAVGHHFYDTFFRICSERLRKDGIMALQAIIIRDDRYREQLKAPDFIKRYIFPGSCIPSVAVICDAVARRTDLRLHHLEDITPHYSRTLRKWRERFFENLDHIRNLGYSETFVRMWEFYLCYCEGSFMERYIGDVQMIFTKPFWRTEAVPSISSSETRE